MSRTQRQIVACAGAGDLALVTTVSSMMPPFSLVMTDREPVLSARPAMSPTTSCSMNFTVSLPCEPRGNRGKCQLRHKHNSQGHRHTAIACPGGQAPVPGDTCLERKAAHVRDVKERRPGAAVLGRVHDAVLVLDRHLPPSERNHLATVRHMVVKQRCALQRTGCVSKAAEKEAAGTLWRHCLQGCCTTKATRTSCSRTHCFDKQRVCDRTHGRWASRGTCFCSADDGVAYRVHGLRQNCLSLHFQGREALIRSANKRASIALLELKSKASLQSPVAQSKAAPHTPQLEVTMSC